MYESIYLEDLARKPVESPYNSVILCAADAYEHPTVMDHVKCTS